MVVCFSLRISPGPHPTLIMRENILDLGKKMFVGHTQTLWCQNITTHAKTKCFGRLILIVINWVYTGVSAFLYSR